MAKFKSLTYLLLAVLCCLMATNVAHADQNKQILILHAYSQEYPWTKGQHLGFVEAIKRHQQNSVIINSEYIDTKRVKYTTDYARQFSDYLSFKYQNYTPDAIYVSDDNGLLFGLDYLSGIFPETPIVFSGVNNEKIQEHIDQKRITGVFEKKELKPNLDILKQFFPATDKINIVGDDSSTFKAIMEDIKEKLPQESLTTFNFISSGQILKIEKSLSASSNTPVLLTTVGSIHDEQGKLMRLQNIIKRIAAATHSVVISMEDAYLLDGVLGGYVTSAQLQGETAANLMASYFDGVPISSLKPITKSPNAYVFNDRVLEKLDLQVPETLREKSKIINPRLTFYQKFKDILIGLALTLAAAFGTTLVLYAIDTTHKNRQLKLQSQRLSEQEKKLKDCEIRFTSLINRSQHSIFIVINEKIIFANRSASHALESESPQKITNIRLSDISPKLQPDGEASDSKASSLFAKAMKLGFYKCNWTFETENKKLFETQVSMTLIPYDSENALFCTFDAEHAGR